MSTDEMKPSVRALHRGIAHVVKCKIDTSYEDKNETSQHQCNDEIFSFYGNTDPIISSCSEVLGVNGRNEALGECFPAEV